MCLGLLAACFPGPCTRWIIDGQDDERALRQRPLGRYGSVGAALAFRPSRGWCRLHRSLDLTGPLLLGGVPNLPEDFPVQNRQFVGCMRNLSIDGRNVDMASFIANNGTRAGIIPSSSA